MLQKLKNWVLRRDAVYAAVIVAVGGWLIRAEFLTPLYVVAAEGVAYYCENIEDSQRQEWRAALAERLAPHGIRIVCAD